jgi:4-carboxymuconolactone decarboxylase
MNRITKLILLFLMTATYNLSHAQDSAKSAEATKTARFKQLSMEDLNVYQQPLGQQVMKVSSIGLGGPYNPLLRRWNSSVPLRLNEFAILIIGRQWRSQVEWFAHAPLAIKAGLSPDIVATLKTQKRPEKMAEDEALVYDFVTELTQNKSVSEATFARARKVFSEQQLVDLTTITGTYVTVAMLLAMADEGVPAGKEPPFKVGEP